ncbi:MAG: sensor histidine kinase [Herbinix sp.]|nr:sensor histidine kinase [Herbinix sp.]
MYDNNEKIENEESMVAEKKSSWLLLKDIANELEEKRYKVKIDIKTKRNLLIELEKQVIEKERTLIHNLDMFSPIYSKSLDEHKSNEEIALVKEELIKLENEQDLLCKRISVLKSAHSFIEVREKNEINEKINEGLRKYGERGLSILEAQEIERQRIARDLHDTTVQNLTSLVHKCELCTKLIDIDSTRAKLELISMSNMVKTVINDMRGIIYNLKPMTLDDLGLSVTIKRFANRLMDNNNINVKVNANEEFKEILPIIKLTFFRIIQEACNNVIKHANATEIIIDIIYEENNITVIIKDDGTGFNNKQLEDNTTHSSSFGLSIMRERISILSGSIDIQSERGIGTTVIVSAPVTICEGDKNENTN